MCLRVTPCYTVVATYEVLPHEHRWVTSGLRGHPGGDNVEITKIVSHGRTWLLSDRRRTIWLGALAAIVFVSGLVGYRTYEVRQYTDLFWRNHTNMTEQSELYGLGRPGLDQSWRVSKDGGHTFERTFFDGNIPGLADGRAGQSMMGLVPYTYGDAEVDGWVFQWGQGAHDGVGLVLRANAETGDMLVFQLNKRDGTWSFRRHLHGTWTTLQGPAASSLINRTDGWNNLLVAIMRGNQYLLFINYKFVGDYTDGTLHAGSVGLYAEDGTVTLRSGGFTVYRTA